MPLQKIVPGLLMVVLVISEYLGSGDATWGRYAPDAAFLIVMFVPEK